MGHCNLQVLGAAYISDITFGTLLYHRKRQEKKVVEGQQALAKAFAQLQATAERGKIGLALARTEPSVPDGYVGWVEDADGKPTVFVQTPSGEELRFPLPASLN